MANHQDHKSEESKPEEPTGRTERSGKRVTTQFLVTVQHGEGEEDQVIEYLSTAGEAKVFKASEQTQRRTGPATDAYGNPYDRSEVVERKVDPSKGTDAYGNPY